MLLVVVTCRVRGDAYVCDPDPIVTVTSPGVVDDAPMRVTVRVFPLAWAKFSMSSVKLTPVDCPATGVPVTLDVDPSDNACTSDTPDGDDHSPDDPSIA